MPSTSDKPLVSVLIPCFNAAPFIGEALASVAAQTWPNIEVVVIDDGSTDDSAKAVEEAGLRNLTLRRQPNRGATAALNEALRLARGEYIQYFDADDVLHPEKIARQMERLNGRPRAVATSRWARFRTEPAEAVDLPEENWCDLPALEWLYRAYANGQRNMYPGNFLIPRNLVDECGSWDERLTLNNDADYFTRLLLLADEVLFCSGSRCFYRSGLNSSLSARTSREALQSQFIVMEKSERILLEREASDRMRRALSVSWQHFAHSYHWLYPDIANEALRRAKSLHPVSVTPEGGRLFKLACRAFGWRMAQKLQLLRSSTRMKEIRS